MSKKSKSSSSSKKTTSKKTSSKKSTPKKTATKKTTASKSSKTPKKSTTSKKTTTKKKSPAKTTAKKSTKTSTKTKKTPSKKTTSTAKKTKPVKKTTKTTSKPSTAKKVVRKKKTKKEEGPLDYYLKAGEISIKVKELLRKKVKVGASALEICEAGEAKIKELGGNWAFPLNVSINNVAAHYSSPPDDDLIIKKSDIVKIDCGVQIEGYVADTAFTVSFNKDYNDLVKASEEATKAAIDLIRPGITTDRIGSEIEDIIRSYDYRPIRELTGHQLDQNLLHGPVTIPNVKVTKGIKLEEGQAFAIETFASTGTGNLIKGESRCYIFQLNPIVVPLRSEAARKVRKVILANYRYFPFTTRWIAKELSVPTAKLGLRLLANKSQIKRYQILSDVRESFVSQSEHTVYLTGDSRIVTTLPNQ